MQTELQTESNKVTLKITGSLTFSDNKDWRTAVLQFLDENGTQHVLDLKGLSDLDSAGLGMMLAMQRWAKDRQRDLKLLFDPESTAGGILQLSKFEEMFGGIEG